MGYWELSKTMMDYSHIVGKPFRNNGRGPDAFDCWGAVIAVGKVMGMDIPDYSYYHCGDPEEILGQYAKRFDNWEDLGKKVKPEPGMVIQFKDDGFGTLHFGIVVEDGYFIHSTKDLGVQMPRLSLPYYKQSIQSFHRLKTNG